MTVNPKPALFHFTLLPGFFKKGIKMINLVQITAFNVWGQYLETIMIIRFFLELNLFYLGLDQFTLQLLLLD